MSQRIQILIAIVIGTFSGGLMGSAVNIALPDISADLGISASVLPWITTAYFVGSAMVLLPGGRSADIIGPRKVFMSGLITVVIASVFCAFSASGMMLIIFRVLQGIGSGLVIATGPVLVIQAFTASERGKALGFYLTSVYAGLTLGPLIGGVMTEQLGWRSLFIMNIPLVLISILMLWRLRKVSDTGVGGTFDLRGGILSAASILVAIYGLTLVPKWEGILIFLAGLGITAVFVWWEKRVETPLLNMNLFSKNRTFTFSNIAALINYSATFGLSMLLSLYLQYIQGFNPQTAGIIMVILPLVQSVIAPIAGNFSDRFGSRNIATLGMILTTGGLAMLYFIGSGTALWYVIAGMALTGFGLALFVSPNTSAIMSSVPTAFYGVASATQATARQLGVMLSLAIVTMIFTLFIGPVTITPEYYPEFVESTRVLMGIFTVLCFTGIFASFARGKAKNN
jgi:EmrB/QacA subfamily drug resistance transporter